MTNEARPPVPFGEQVKAQFMFAKSRMRPNEVDEFALVDGLLLRHGRIDWERTSQPRNVKSMMTSSMAALHYAHIKTGRGSEYMQNFMQTEPQKWAAVIDTVLDDSEMSDIFYENLGRRVTTASPQRGVPLQYILRHRFGDQPISGVDLGAGMHFALPLLNSPFYRDHQFEGRDRLIERLGGDAVNLQLGIGVDLQNGREDLDWVKAGHWPMERSLRTIAQFDEAYGFASQDVARFPFVVADVTDREKCRAEVESVLIQNGRKPEVDMVLSSYVRYQLGDGNSVAQQEFSGLVTDLLGEGGIWIDIGEELLAPDKYNLNSNVRIYTKRDQDLQSVGVPFMLKDQLHTRLIDPAFFE